MAMRRLFTAGATVSIAVLLQGGSVGATMFVPETDLPAGTPGEPAAATPAGTSSVLTDLQSSDVDAFAVCVSDPAALHVVATPVDANGVARPMDTVLRVFDAAGTLVAVNDDRIGMRVDDGSEILPGTAGASAPGVHTVVVTPFRAIARTATNAEIAAPGDGPLDHWSLGSTSNPGFVRVDLLAGASGSTGCGDPEPAPEEPEEPAPAVGVTTGNGRCQPLGGKAVDKGKATGLATAAEHRRNQPC
jgi:hypothetical protein